MRVPRLATLALAGALAGALALAWLGRRARSRRAPERPPMNANPLIDTRRPCLLDVLIALDELGYDCFSDGRQALYLVPARPGRAPDLPGWLAAGIRDHTPELVRRLRRPPGPVLEIPGPAVGDTKP